MSKFKAVVLKADGTNCETETDFILRKVGFESEIVHMNELLSKEKRLNDYSFIVFPGGFSYGDYTGSGRIVSSIIKHHLIEDIAAFIKAGKIIFGICNGFQVLVKAGILPGTALKGEQEVSLSFNDSHHYEDRWVRMRTYPNSIFTKEMDDTVEFPIAHGEGKFIFESEESVRNRVIFKYINKDGSDAENYPENPNGSMSSIAGIADPTGHIAGMMPHPERFIRREQYYAGGFLKVPFGIRIFENAYHYVKEEL